MTEKKLSKDERSIIHHLVNNWMFWRVMENDAHPELYNYCYEQSEKARKEFDGFLRDITIDMKRMVE